MKKIVRCLSCEGYGWYEDEFTSETTDCDWCDGVGYVYRDAQNIDHKIPLEDLKQPDISAQLELLEGERLRKASASRAFARSVRMGPGLALRAIRDDKGLGEDAW
jgi:hypothetical protein